jgi:hypothetical protein
MPKRILFALMLVGWLLVGGAIAQDSGDLKTFQPRESFITFDYPSNWLARENGRVVALASDESVLPLTINQPLISGQFKILLVYLTAEQRTQSNIKGTNLESILQSVIENSNIPITDTDTRQYEFNRRLTLRTDFTNDNNEGSIWVMQMEDDAIALMQVVTALGEVRQVEGQTIEILRNLDLSAITKQLYAIPDLDRPLLFNPQKTRLVFDYPEGWAVNEPTATTVVLDQEQIQISLQFFDYTDLSHQGIPIDDPTDVLFSLQNRSERPTAFTNVQQVIVNNQTLPHSTITGEGFTGVSLGRDIKVGFLWVSIVMTGDAVPDDLSTLAWALLLTTTYRPDPINLTERVTMPQHQFEFFHPADWLIQEQTPSSYLLGTSQAMIDNVPDNLLFTDDAQLLIQYVSEADYSIARAGTTNAIQVLQKFIGSASDLTTYDTPRTVTLGAFEFAQADFDNPAYSGTLLLTPMRDGGAVWIQLRTPPAELGDWEPVARAIARSSRVVTLDTTNGNSLDEAIFDALDIEPTPIPTPTRRPDAPPALDDVIKDVVATPIPVPDNIRELNFNLPALASSYTTNVSNFTADFPTDWLVQETVPESDASPAFENTIRLSNNPNLLLSNPKGINEGDVQMTVRYSRYADMRMLGFFGDTLFDVVQKIVTVFPEGTFEPPLQLRINGEIMIVVASTTNTRQTLSIYRHLSDDGYATVELVVNPIELELWLPTAIAVVQSVDLP